MGFVVEYLLEFLQSGNAKDGAAILADIVTGGD